MLNIREDGKDRVRANYKGSWRVRFLNVENWVTINGFRWTAIKCHDFRIAKKKKKSTKGSDRKG